MVKEVGGGGKAMIEGKISNRTAQKKTKKDEIFTGNSYFFVVILYVCIYIVRKIRSLLKMKND